METIVTSETKAVVMLTLVSLAAPPVYMYVCRHQIMMSMHWVCLVSMCMLISSLPGAGVSFPDVDVSAAWDIKSVYVATVV